MMQTEAVREILRNIRFLTYEFHIVEMKTALISGWLLHATFHRHDRETGKLGIGTSRSEFLRADCTEDTVVKTVWVIVKLTVEHEAMEFFHYGGKRVFDPHMPVSALIGLQAAPREE